MREGRPKFAQDPQALDELATGEIFTGAQAEQLGLVDKLGFIEDAIERVTQRPTQLMEAMNTRMDGLYLLVSERTERRNRFIYWLFGTNDWLAASWPERRRAAVPPQA